MATTAAPRGGDKNLKIFSGTAHPDFAHRVCVELGVPLSAARHFRFSDGEIGLSLDESVRGADVYVIQPTCAPANENLMQLLVMTDALKRASARRVNAVMPYFGYARQDRKARPREPITAKLVANLLTSAALLLLPLGPAVDVALTCPPDAQCAVGNGFRDDGAGRGRRAVPQRHGGHKHGV